MAVCSVRMQTTYTHAHSFVAVMRPGQLDMDIVDYLAAHGISSPLTETQIIALAAKVMYTELDADKATTIARHLLRSVCINAHNLRRIIRSPRMRVLMGLMAPNHQSYKGKV